MIYTKKVMTMLDTETIKAKLQSALSIERYIHTLGVADEAMKLLPDTAVRSWLKKRKQRGFSMTAPRIIPRI